MAVSPTKRSTTKTVLKYAGLTLVVLFFIQLISFITLSDRRILKTVVLDSEFNSRSYGSLNEWICVVMHDHNESNMMIHAPYQQIINAIKIVPTDIESQNFIRDYFGKYYKYFYFNEKEIPEKYIEYILGKEHGPTYRKGIRLKLRLCNYSLLNPWFIPFYTRVDFDYSIGFTIRGGLSGRETREYFWFFYKWVRIR